MSAIGFTSTATSSSLLNHSRWARCYKRILDKKLQLNLENFEYRGEALDCLDTIIFRSSLIILQFLFFLSITRLFVKWGFVKNDNLIIFVKNENIMISGIQTDVRDS